MSDERPIEGGGVSDEAVIDPDLAYRVPGDRRTPRPLWTEWVLTNGLGGYAMGTAAGMPTRRYHGLLVAAMRPPVERVVALSAVAERFVVDASTEREREWYLTPFQFRDAPAWPMVPPCRFSFEKSPGRVAWTFGLDIAGAPDARIVKELVFFSGHNAAALRYRVENVGRPWWLDVRPLIALRDFHSLLRRERFESRYHTRPLEGGVLCATREAGVHLTGEGLTFAPGREHWRSIAYVWEDLRGVDSVESLLCPGVFFAGDEKGEDAEVTVWASVDAIRPSSIEEELESRAKRVRVLCERTVGSAGSDALNTADTRAIKRLAVSADDFVVRRGQGEDAMSSVIAGYPWFSDWGRDTMISLPGLMLATGRFEEAKRAITVFGRHRRRGLIPNRFDDYSGPAHYNTVDAPLWFLHAASEYRRVSGDDAGYLRDLAPACLDVIDAYIRGTDHSIRMDPADHLVNAGDMHTQLTWMDAQRDGVTFTPRYGKAVEINALWFNGLIATAAGIEPQFGGRAGELRALADKVAASFTEHFIDPSTGGLFDRIEPVLGGDGVTIVDWKPVSEIRPNQVFAVSLPNSPLAERYREGVLAVIQEHLVTPHGLRTLAQHERGYVGRLRGSMFERDSAYHNGTVWPWLMGPFAEAVLRVGRFSDASRARARDLLRPLIEVLEDRYPGTIAEIYDGDDTPERPQKADGCIAQAWSVAETLRVMMLTVRGGLA